MIKGNGNGIATSCTKWRRSLALVNTNYDSRGYQCMTVDTVNTVSTASAVDIAYWRLKSPGNS